MDNREKLLELMSEYPELPVIPLIGMSYIDSCNDSVAEGLGELGGVVLSEYGLYPMYDEMCYILKFNQVVLEEYLLQNHPCSGSLDAHHYVESELDKIEWKKAIFVFVRVA